MHSRTLRFSRAIKLRDKIATCDTSLILSFDVTSRSIKTYCRDVQCMSEYKAVFNVSPNTYITLYHCGDKAFSARQTKNSV